MYVDFREATPIYRYFSLPTIRINSDWIREASLFIFN